MAFIFLKLRIILTFKVTKKYEYVTPMKFILKFYNFLKPKWLNDLKKFEQFHQICSKKPGREQRKTAKNNAFFYWFLKIAWKMWFGWLIFKPNDRQKTEGNHWLHCTTLGDLDTTIMFATAGSLHPDGGAGAGGGAESFGARRDAILRTAKALVEDTKALVAGAASSQEQLAVAAHNAVRTIVQLADVVKCGAAALTAQHSESQVFFCILWEFC